MKCFIFHDWENINDKERVCLKCQKHQVWWAEGWYPAEYVERTIKETAERKKRASEIIKNKQNDSKLNNREGVEEEDFIP